MEASTVLQELLGDELKLDTTTVEGFTNHLPMALVAKQRLGADEAELRRFATLYSRRLAPLTKGAERLNEHSWIDAIGNRDAAGDLRDYFGRAVDQFGVDESLRNHLPALLPGVGGAAFHGVIRLAYAIDAGSATQVAAGLAYFAQVARPLGELPETTGRSLDPAAILGALSNSPQWSTPPPVYSIDEQLRLVSASDGFEEIASSLTVDAETESKLAALALQLYASTDNFTALHGVTGLDAISILRPWITDQSSVDRYAFQALAAAYLSIGAPAIWSADRLAEFAETTEADIDEVSSTAAFCDDEHEAKLVYTALGGYERTREPLYLAVAERAVTSTP